MLFAFAASQSADADVASSHPSDAPALRSWRAIPWNPRWMVRLSGVRPSTSRSECEAPSSSSTPTASFLPRAAATCSAVWLSLSTSSMLIAVSVDIGLSSTRSVWSFPSLAASNIVSSCDACFSETSSIPAEMVTFAVASSPCRSVAMARVFLRILKTSRGNSWAMILYPSRESMRQDVCTIARIVASCFVPKRKAYSPMAVPTSLITRIARWSARSFSRASYCSSSRSSLSTPSSGGSIVDWTFPETRK
mmetsp:Transcript_3479/g.8780  ORF Transcript_3479/g.8780 Transcript_3479/m.8780 type:complete len:250 (-) Transcript_3479:655-1404(-)